MRRNTAYIFRKYLPVSLTKRLARYRKMVQVFRDFNGRHKRECPICGYRGFFYAVGVPLRFDAACSRCCSVERHRQHHLLTREHPEWIDGADILHFAAEECFTEAYRSRASRYIMADYDPTRDEVQVDIQAIPFSDNSFDTVICHQVLEHVQDDIAAIKELHRVVRPRGRVLLSTPEVAKWPRSFADPETSDPKMRDLLFGQSDHFRLYGADFKDYLIKAGFEIFEYIAQEPDVSKYGLVRGETIYVAMKVVASDARH
jgi:SAM-dependent methyltransferase